MKVVFVLALVTSFFADNHALPVGNERQREDVVTKCLVEVLSKALSKPDSHPLDQECKDILKAGPKHAPLEKKSNEEVLTPEEEVKGHEEVPGAEDDDVKDIRALLKSVAEKREEIPEDERSQESWGLDEEKEKRHHEEEEEEGEREKRIWKPTHRYHHKKHRKRDEELSEEEPDEERSQESWDLDDGKEKRSWGSEEREKRIWKPTHRYHHKKHRKRDEEPSEEVGEGPGDEERSQESWGLDDEEEKRSLNGDEREKRAWKPTHKYPSRRLRKRDEEPSEEVREEPDEERSQESWGLDEEKRSLNGDKRTWKPTHKYPSRRLRKRDEEASEEVREEPDEERSQESWGLDEVEKRSSNGDEREKRAWKSTHRYPSRRLRKRDEEASEEVRGEPDEERSQESWGLDEVEKRRSLDGDEREKRAWKLMHKYPNKRLRKRDEEASEEVREGLGDEERSQESWGLDDDKEKRAEEENEEREKRIWKPTHRYHHKKHRKRSGGSSEEEEEEEERRSDSGEYEEEKRYEDAEREREVALRFLAEKRGERARHLLAEGEVYDKRSPWAYRGYYHSAWWKRNPEGHAPPSHKMEDLTRLLSLVRNEAVRRPDEKKRLRQMPLTPEEEKELDSLAAMDRELQQIAEKMHDRRGE